MTIFYLTNIFLYVNNTFLYNSNTLIEVVYEYFWFSLRDGPLYPTDCAGSLIEFLAITSQENFRSLWQAAYKKYKKDHTSSEILSGEEVSRHLYLILFSNVLEVKKEMFYLMIHSTHFIYNYLVKDHSDIEKRKPLITFHGLFFLISSNAFLYAPSHRQDSPVVNH